MVLASTASSLIHLFHAVAALMTCEMNHSLICSCLSLLGGVANRRILKGLDGVVVGGFRYSHGAVCSKGSSICQMMKINCSGGMKKKGKAMRRIHKKVDELLRYGLLRALCNPLCPKGTALSFSDSRSVCLLVFQLDICLPRRTNGRG